MVTTFVTHADGSEVRFAVWMAWVMTSTVFLVVALCTVGGTFRSSLMALFWKYKVDAIGTSETSVSIFMSTRLHIQKDSIFQMFRYFISLDILLSAGPPLNWFLGPLHCYVVRVFVTLANSWGLDYAGQIFLYRLDVCWQECQYDVHSLSSCVINHLSLNTCTCTMVDM